jgi:hypothetical protein
MKKLDIPNHFMMLRGEESRLCEFFLLSDEYMTYILPSKTDLFYYQVMIKPYTNATLRDVETLEDLILTPSTYFSVLFCDIQNNLLDTLYTRRESSSNYILN